MAGTDPSNVRRSYRDLIHTAYENVAFAPADTVKNGQYEISGRSRPATTNANGATAAPPPLSIDASCDDWSDLETLWLADDLREDDLEDLFIDEIIGAGTDGWEFSGSSYTVELR